MPSGPAHAAQSATLLHDVPMAPIVFGRLPCSFALLVFRDSNFFDEALQFGWRIRPSSDRPKIPRPFPDRQGGDVARTIMQIVPTRWARQVSPTKPSDDAARMEDMFTVQGVHVIVGNGFQTDGANAVRPFRLTHCDAGFEDTQLANTDTAFIFFMDDNCQSQWCVFQG